MKHNYCQYSTVTGAIWNLVHFIVCRLTIIVDHEITADDPGDVSGSLTTVVVKPASFAAALKSAPTTPRAVIKDSDSQTTVVDTDGVFSTKVCRQGKNLNL